MQFKHPEILYFLGLLLLPILVHLFQLQRYVKVPFTNVAFLQKLVLQTRKSSQIKKWLILATRLLLFTALILAFAKPYFSNHKIEEQQSFLVYLDNSLSLSAKGNKGELLPVATQEIIENLNKSANYSLLTNTNFYKNISSERMKEVLLKTKASGANNNFNSTLLKTKNYNNASQQTILISDFQNTSENNFKNISENTTLVQITPELKSNLRIDSVSVNYDGSSNINVEVLISNTGAAKENVPISIFNDETLVNKQTFSIEENGTSNVSFTVQKSEIFLGKIVLQTNDTYSFDNTFYFVVNTNNKTNVLAVGSDNDFLKRIYTANEFNFKSTSVNSIDYNSINQLQLIIINELETIPVALANSLVDFSKKGGNIVVIPDTNSDLKNYNTFFKNLNAGSIQKVQKDTLKITNINFEHPLFKGVFEKKVTNFQYPTTNTYFESNLINSSTLVSFENKQEFIKQINLTNSKLFWVASPLNKTTTNFTNSPLVVPVFYNMGMMSFQHPKLFYRTGKENIIEVAKQLTKDDVLTINNGKTSFIPLQQAYQNKVKITTSNQPAENGFYNINYADDVVKQLAYNYPKEESNLSFFDINKLVTNDKITVSRSISDTLEKINDKSKVHWLSKWFLALAIVSLLLEILILKFFKP